jgi:hypothetical protein
MAGKRRTYAPGWATEALPVKLMTVPFVTVDAGP